MCITEGCIKVMTAILYSFKFFMYFFPGGAMGRTTGVVVVSGVCWLDIYDMDLV